MCTLDDSIALQSHHRFAPVECSPYALSQSVSTWQMGSVYYLWVVYIGQMGSIYY